ncbi:MAG: T9SS type A sorting domain-containing protein, partial [Nonlabens ulvanivorans]|uniref:T9SS type A sorting domain-containing protein n=4 Tax=Nonlabens TaxID=363408 RepID=UPI0032975322
PSSQEISLSGVLESLTLLGDVNLNNTAELNGFLNLISGDLTTNDNLTLKSIDGKSAVVREVVAGTVTGDVKVEQFYPAQRAFRFIGSSVNMTGSVYDNWQQGGLNVGDAGYVTGNGTHITGGSMADGFDVSGSNNPSAFSFNEDTQLWESTSATNSTSLTAGDAMRVLIRGDRSVSLTTADVMSSSTTLISKGSLYLGDFTTTGLSTTDGGFNFVGNPYQAQVNLNSVLNDAATVDIDVNQYYAWDPTIGTRGAYVTHDFVLGNSNTTSEVSEFVQPGQAFFVTTAEDGDNAAALAPSISFKESHKSTSFETTNTYRNSNVNEQISVSLYTDQELASGKARDGVLLSFNLSAANSFTAKGAVKLQNPDENLSIEAMNSSLSIIERLEPVDNELIPLKLNGLTAIDYTFDINNALTNLQTLFVDHFLGTETLMVNGSNLVSISFDTAIAASVDENRFELKFLNSTLSVGDIAFAEAVQVYPNPVNEDNVTIGNLIVGESVKISIYNTLGQLIASYQKESTNGIEKVTNMNSLKN